MIECNDKHVYSYQVRAQKVALAITSLVSGISLSLSRPNKVNMCTIRIYTECEGRIEKSVTRMVVWHHEACRVMTNSDPQGQNFLSYPHTNTGLFFLLTTVFIYLF